MSYNHKEFVWRFVTLVVLSVLFGLLLGSLPACGKARSRYERPPYGVPSSPTQPGSTPTQAPTELPSPTPTVTPDCRGHHGRCG